MHAVELAADCECCIFEDEELVLFRQSHHLGHVDRHAEIMHDRNPFRAWRYSGLDGREVDIPGHALGIDEHRPCTNKCNRVRRRSVCLSRNDDLVASAEPEREPDEMHAGRARGHGDRMRGTSEGREIGFELRRARSVHENRSRQDLHHGGALGLADHRLSKRD